jgi:hypothetical protein
MQIDKLVQLLESPVFIPIRLHLLDVNSKHHRNLLKSLYGLLMMLPQSQAYKTLSDRLSTVSSLKMHLSMNCSKQAGVGGQQKIVSSTGEGAITSPAHQLILSDLPPSSVPYGPLLQHFEDIQERHNDFKRQVFRQQNKLSLIGLSGKDRGGEGVGGVAVMAAPGRGGMGNLSARSMSPDGMGTEPLMKSASTTESV